ncbi:MAG: hypothetical protein ACOX2E_08950 [Syntrophaceticus sp.]
MRLAQKLAAELKFVAELASILTDEIIGFMGKALSGRFLSMMNQ